MYMNSHTILKDQLYAWTKSLTSYWAMQGNHCPCVRVTIRKQIRNMSGMAPAARRIIKRLEIHYTPKHGSWLDIAEIELNVMTRQCLSRRIENIARVRYSVGAQLTYMDNVGITLSGNNNEIEGIHVINTKTLYIGIAKHNANGKQNYIYSVPRSSI